MGGAPAKDDNEFLQGIHVYIGNWTLSPFLHYELLL